MIGGDGRFKKHGDTPRVLPVAGGEPAAMGSVAANTATREALLAHGDDGRVPRIVSHWAYPSAKDAASLAEWAEGLRNAGFEVFGLEGGGLNFEHRTEVASDSFDMLTWELYVSMEASGWEYDGWECEVITSAGESR